MAAAEPETGDGGGAGAGAADFFRPEDHELIDQFLRPKMAGRPLPPAARFIHDADVCSAAPGDLAAAHEPAPGPPGADPVWYFFSPVRSHCGSRFSRYARFVRGSARGAWCADRVGRRAEEGGAVVWYARQFSFLARSAGRCWLSEWRMVEHGIMQEDGDQRQLVLCKLFISRES
ncbi:hypothetical protein ACP70R_011674 [Stipagrostis hirtigluma subsp. patula]